MPYREAMDVLKKTIQDGRNEFLVWKERLHHASTFQELYDLNSEIRLATARLLLLWDTGCVDAVRDFWTLYQDQRRSMFDHMHS